MSPWQIILVGLLLLGGVYLAVSTPDDVVVPRWGFLVPFAAALLIVCMSAGCAISVRLDSDRALVDVKPAPPPQCPASEESAPCPGQP